MSTAFGNGFGAAQPFHSHFHQPFTSTLTPGFNVWPVILTATLFFTVLSWYNTFLAVYEYYFQYPHKPDVLYNNLLTLTFFAIAWTVITVLLYLWLSGRGMLTTSKNGDIGDDFRPSADAGELLSEALSPI